jgi:hypothetical protein
MVLPLRQRQLQRRFQPLLNAGFRATGSTVVGSPDAHFPAPDDTRARLCSGSLTQDAALQQTMRQAQQIVGLPASSSSSSSQIGS